MELTPEPLAAHVAARLASHPRLNGHRPLGRYFQKIIRALVEVVLPRAPNGEPVDAATLDRVTAYAARYTCFMPRLLRLALPIGLLTLQLGAFVLGPSLVPFTAMSVERRRRYVHGWVHSRLRMFRDLIKGMKGICFLPYYSDPAVQRALAYTPEEHVALVKAERLKRHAADL